MARVGSMVAQVVGQGHRAAAAAATVAARVHGSRALSVAPPAAAAAAAAATSPAAAEAPVGIVMLNMGGPGSLHDPHTGVQAFLGRLFGDPEIIRLGPLQRVLVREVCTHCPRHARHHHSLPHTIPPTPPQHTHGRAPG